MSKNENVSSTDNKDVKVEETISIPKSQLDAILSKIERLEFAADKARTSVFDINHKEDQQKVVKLLTFDGKIIEKWDNMPINTCEKNANTGIFNEQQRIRFYYFGDENPVEMDYFKWSKGYQKLPAIILEESLLRSSEDVSKYGSYKLKVKDFDGNEYVIGSKFVN